MNCETRRTCRKHPFMIKTRLSFFNVKSPILTHVNPMIPAVLFAEVEIPVSCQGIARVFFYVDA